jgi:hypothetical protein
MRRPRAALLAGALALAATSGTPSGAAPGAPTGVEHEVPVDIAEAGGATAVGSPQVPDLDVEVTLVPGRVRHLADAPCSPSC